MFCWKSGAETQIITGIDIHLGLNEYRFSVADLGDYSDLFDFARLRLPNDLWIGCIKYRFSKTQERSNLNNGCAHCDVLIGDLC